MREKNSTFAKSIRNLTKVKAGFHLVYIAGIAQKFFVSLFSFMHGARALYKTKQRNKEFFMLCLQSTPNGNQPQRKQRNSCVRVW